MTYVPINLNAYTAAYAGAVAGLAVNGWITNPSGTNYTKVCQIAGAFAQEFDIVWNSSVAVNGLEYAAIQEVVLEEFSLRAPGPLENPQFLDVTNWAIPARACATLVLESDLYFASQGITPPPGPNSGERLPTQMALAEVFREDWMAGVATPSTRSGVVNPGFQTNKLQPTGLLYVNDPFTNTNPARFTQVTESTNVTLTLPGTTCVLTSPATGAHQSMVYEGTPLNIPQLMTSVRLVSRTGVNGAYSAILLGIVKDGNNYITLNYDTVANNVNLQTKIGGVINFNLGFGLALGSAPFTLGFSLVGNWVTGYVLMENGVNANIWQKMFGFDLSVYIDMKAQNLALWFAAFGFATPGTSVNAATFSSFKAGRFGGVGIRDICICSHPDGSPYFLSATQVAALATLAAPSGGIQESSLGCFAIDLEKKTFTQTGVIMVSRGGKIQNDHAGQLVIENNGDQHYLVSSWGDTPGPVRVYYFFQVAAVNLLNGSNVVAATAFALPDPGAPSAAIDYYDPYLIRKTGIYYLAYTVSTAGTGTPFYPVLAKTTSISVPVWTLIGFDNTANRYEGTRILPFNNTSYVLTGGQFNMRMYDLGMNFVGVVNCLSPGDGTTQPHAMVFPYNTLFLLITFDQTKWPTVGGLDFSWGSHHWFAGPRF